MSSMPASPEPANSAPPASSRNVKPITLSRWFSVTTTTSPRRARASPSVIGDEPEPVAKPPPWHHTITGRLRLSPSAGVHTFKTRQSSFSWRMPAPATARSDVFGAVPGSRCGALGPYASESRTPVHLAGSTGGRNRLRPAVLAP